MDYLFTSNGCIALSLWFGSAELSEAPWIGFTSKRTTQPDSAGSSLFLPNSSIGACRFTQGPLQQEQTPPTKIENSKQLDWTEPLGQQKTKLKQDRFDRCAYANNGRRRRWWWRKTGQASSLWSSSLPRCATSFSSQLQAIPCFQAFPLTLNTSSIYCKKRKKRSLSAVNKWARTNCRNQCRLLNANPPVMRAATDVLR